MNEKKAQPAKRRGKDKNAAPAPQPIPPAERRALAMSARQPKFGIGARVVANDHAPSQYRGRVGTVKEIGPKKSEYRVSYGDGAAPPTAPLMSWWLDLKR